jgi:two-component system, OmpR family, response regulator
VRVLVVDDHLETRKLLVRNLALAAHGVITAASCAEAKTALGTESFDVVILDVMLPDGSGIDLCAQLRALRVQVPILLLTARADVPSRVSGLDAGADDYLAKPFALAELLARVNALGRRGPILRDRSVTFGAVVVDFEARRVRIEGKAVPLTAKELAIVNLLAARCGRVVPRDQLIECVWGDVTDSARASLEVLVARIRRKLGESAGLLRTVRGLGYAFDYDE